MDGKKYPDVLRVDLDGRKRKFGARQNSCPNSPTYRKYSVLLAKKSQNAMAKEKVFWRSTFPTNTEACVTAKTAKRHSVYGSKINTKQYKNSTKHGIHPSGDTPTTTGKTYRFP